MDKILYTIHSGGVIPALHNIHGPVLTPIALDEQDVINMIRKGYVIYAHNPYNKKEKVKLNYKNFNKVSFAVSREERIKKDAKFKKNRDDKEKVQQEALTQTSPRTIRETPKTETPAEPKNNAPISSITTDFKKM